MLISKRSISRSAAALVAFAFVISAWINGNTCTALIAGKKTTADGSILFAKTEDDSAGDVDYLWYIPAGTHDKGTTLRLRNGGEIPQAAETYAYLWDQNPGTEWSNFLVNQWGLALGSNACPSREDSVEELEKRGLLKDGGIGWRLRFILAERCRTAREAVELASELLEEYGYGGSGRTLSIVGPEEAWILQMVRGRQYVARRVGEEEVVAVANCYTIHKVDSRDSDRFVCSEGLVDYAIERGWYDPVKDGEFDFAKAYSDEKSRTAPYNTRRHWMMARMINRDFPLSWEDADRGKMPVAFKADRKLALRDVMAVMRTHFEGTGLDDSEGYRRSPHRNANRPICTYRTHRTTVVQQRDWLPVGIGTVVWRALYEPCSSGFVPWYLCVTDIPEPFRKAPVSLYETRSSVYDFHFNMPDERRAVDFGSASSLFGVMAGLVDSDYLNVTEYVRHQWREFEEEEFEMQPVIENQAEKLFEMDERAGSLFLTSYTHSRAAESMDLAKAIVLKLQHRLWNARRGTPLLYTVELPQEDLKAFAGRYRFDEGQKEDGFVIYTDEGRIFFDDGRREDMELMAHSGTCLFFEEIEGRIIFEKDENGLVKGCTLFYRGREDDARKVE